jgi:hypothetical protein
MFVAVAVYTILINQVSWHEAIKEFIVNGIVEEEHAIVPEYHGPQEQHSKTVDYHRGRFNYTNTTWCPKAGCEQSELCFPCQRRFLIVLASGRSASTTLTWMLDSLPGIRMSGENNGTLLRIQDMIANVRDNEFFETQEGKKAAWGHNKVPEGGWACMGQHVIETINPPWLKKTITDNLPRLVKDDSETILGFKNIRTISRRDKRDDPKTVDFIREIFPCSRIIINIRSDVEELAASQAKAFHKMNSNKATNVLREETNRLRQMAEMFGDQGLLIDSSEWTKNINVINEAVEWLGFSQECFFKELLEFNTKGRGYGAGRKSLTIDPKCKYLG